MCSLITFNSILLCVSHDHHMTIGMLIEVGDRGQLSSVSFLHTRLCGDVSGNTELPEVAFDTVLFLNKAGSCYIFPLLRAEK